MIEAAVWWQHAGDLRAKDHWLRRTLQEIDVARLGRLLAHTSDDTTVRVAYLLDRFGSPETARHLAHRTSRSQLVFFGPREANSRTYQADWRLYDGIGVATK